MLFNLFAENVFPIGAEITPTFVRMAQLGRSDKRIGLTAGGCESLPEGIEPYSGQWQRCVIEAIKSIYSEAPFKSKNAITIIPSNDVLSREIKRNLDDKSAEEIINSEAKKLLPEDSEDAVVKYIILNPNVDSSGEKDILILAAEKFKVERHLAVFEQAGMNAKAVTAWPMVLVNCYVNFFGRRRTDAETVVMLINATATGCNAVICRKENILFARAIPFGTGTFAEPSGEKKLATEIEACIRYFQTAVKTTAVERIILLANEGADQKLKGCILTVAKKYAMPAHIGDVLAAVSNHDIYKRGIDGRGAKDDWTTVFGLSLSGSGNQG